MLVADGGTKLRDARSGDGLLAAWAEILPRCADLQRTLAPQVDAILATGTPDHGSSLLIAGLRGAIEEEPALYGARDGRLTVSEREALERLVPSVERHCRELASFGIADTVQHDDLHDGNVLMRDGRAVIFDWGDACVSHPFFTLTVTLRVVAFRAGLDEWSPALERLRDAYLEPWRDLASRPELVRAAELARRLGQVSRVLCWHRVARAYPDVIDAYPGFSDTMRLVVELIAPLERLTRH
jgi:hypothetical protein